LALLVVKSSILPGSALGAIAYLIGGRLMEIMNSERS
jgi:hypothetical protein